MNIIIEILRNGDNNGFKDELNEYNNGSQWYTS